MLGSPAQDFEHLELQLESKIREIASIREMLLGEMVEREKTERHRHNVKEYAMRVLQFAQSFRQLISDIPKVMKSFMTQFVKDVEKMLIGHLGKEVKNCEQTPIRRYSNQLSESSKKLLSLKNQSQSASSFLCKYEIVSPCNRLFPMDHLDEAREMQVEPAIEIPCVKLDTITEEDDISSKNKNSKRNIEFNRTDPTQFKPPTRPTKDINKVCIEDLAKMIDKVTPSKTLIHNASRLARKQGSFINDFVEFTAEDADIRCSWLQPKNDVVNRQRSNSISNIKPGSFIELGGRKKSSSKQQNNDKQASRASIFDIRNQRSQSKEKIKVTVKENKPQTMRFSNTDSQTHKGSGNKRTTTVAQPKIQQLLCLKNQLYSQLPKLEFNVGDRRYELRYEGTKKDNMRCGRGRLEYMNGLVYEGEFKDDVRHGNGILLINGKQVYNGTWRNDQMCGRGILKQIHAISRKKIPEQSLLKSIEYEGEFRANLFHGHGTIFLPNGSLLFGSFFNNVPQGELQDRVKGFTRLGSSNCVALRQ